MTTPAPNCLNCEHAAYPAGQVICWVYEQPIVDERRQAEDCPMFTPLDPIPIPPRSST